MHPLRAGLTVLLAAALAACTTFSPDGGQAQVRQLAAARGQALPDAGAGEREARIARLLAAPLSADAAVDIALLNNRTLQASYAELGIAEADLVQAGRLPNPVFTFSRLRGHDGVEIERQLMLPVIGLLTMPLARPLEARRYEMVQMRTAGDALRVADETRRAWTAAVAAQQSANYMEQVKSAAEAGADLAARMAQAGNWSALQQAREQGFYADAVAQLARARHASTVEREKLTRLMGLSGRSAAFTLPERLPELPAQARAVQDAEGAAMANRLDVLMAQKELAGLAASLGLTRSTRFVNLLDVSWLHNQGADGARTNGYEIELQIPLFDWGGARVAKAEAMYMQAAQRAAGITIDAGSQVREAYSGYRTAYELARHYRDEVVPLKKKISDEQLLRYNGMLISVFELLADAREQVASVNAAIEAQRDFWIADAALQAAMTGAGGAGPALRAAPAAAAAPQH